MPKQGLSSANQGLRALAARFAHWRRTRALPQERIPAALWAQAARLSTVVPISRVAETLRVSRGALKAQRAAYLQRQSSSALPTPVQFVAVAASPVEPALANGVEVEVTRPDGVRLRIHYRATVPSLTTFVRGLLEEDTWCN
jgi:hypothetical protein